MFVDFGIGRLNLQSPPAHVTLRMSSMIDRHETTDTALYSNSLNYNSRLIRDSSDANTNVQHELSTGAMLTKLLVDKLKTSSIPT